MGERPRLLRLFAVERVGRRGLVGDVGQLGDAGLHPEGQLVLLDPRVRLGVAHELVVHLVEGLEPVERVAAHLRRNARRVVDVQDRVAAAAERDPGVLARQVARRPQPRRDRLQLLGVRRLGHQHDERRQVVVERAQAVRGPGAQARPAGDLVAGLHVGDRRLVVDRLGVHAPDEAHVVDHPGRVGQQLADPHAALAVPGELVLRRGDREPLLARGHRRQPLAHPDRVGQVLVVELVHLRLVVVQVHLRRPADHVQVDHLLGLGGEVQPRRPADGPPSGDRPRCPPAWADGARPSRPRSAANAAQLTAFEPRLRNCRRVS